MKKILFLSIAVLFFLSLFLPFFHFARADEVADLQNKIVEYEKQVEELQKQASSLGQQISLMDSQIKVTSLRISQTEAKTKVLEGEIEILSGKIIRLDDSLNFLSKVLISRVAESYKTKRTSPLVMFFSSKNFSDLISRYRYLQKAQLHDRELLISMEQTRLNYDEQKALKEKAQADLEKLQKQLEEQKKLLNTQIADRKRLLEETKGKEANYQKLLAAARSELEAILGILEGRGKEVKVKDVSEGERIASLIQGESCNSSGMHLHFIINQDGNTVNPFQRLKGGIDFENCSGSSCSSSDGDQFNPSGDWNWPVNPKISFFQGYGNTWAIQHTWVGRIYKFHNGIDIKGSSSEVKAVKGGTLYAGSYNGSCTLKYVRVQHSEGNLDTYYLHVNY